MTNWLNQQKLLCKARAGTGRLAARWAAKHRDGVCDKDEMRTHYVDLMADILHGLHVDGFDPHDAHVMAMVHFTDELAESRREPQ